MLIVAEQDQKTQKTEKGNVNLIPNKKLLKSVKNSWFYIDSKVDTKNRANHTVFPRFSVISGPKNHEKPDEFPLAKSMIFLGQILKFKSAISPRVLNRFQ